MSTYTTDDLRKTAIKAAEAAVAVVLERLPNFEPDRKRMLDAIDKVLDGERLDRNDRRSDIGWSILELMGHRRLGGYVREVELAGAPMLRLDVPVGEATLEEADIGATQFYSPSALYCLTPTTEEMARAVAASSQPEPVKRWELPERTGQKNPVDYESERVFDDDEDGPDPADSPDDDHPF